MSAEGAPTAQVQIVDRYNHDAVKVVVATTTHQLAYGHRTGWFAIPPSSSRHEGISVTSVKHHCGVGEPDEVFQAGHRYRVVVYPSKDRCFIGGGKSIANPEFTLTKVS